MQDLIYTEITVIHQNRLDPRREHTLFKEMIDKAHLVEYSLFDDCANFEDRDSDSIRKIIALSTQYPSLLLEATGRDQYHHDLFKMRIRAGASEAHKACVTYPPFTELITSEERAAIRWKASRKGPRTSSRYNANVVKALRLLEAAAAEKPRKWVRTDPDARTQLHAAIDILETLKRKMR